MPPSTTDEPRPPVGAVPGRLRRSADYARVQASGRRIRAPHLLVVVARGTEADSRVGWTVSRKVGGAVTRNRVKRWIREAVRAVPGPRGGPWDLVLIPHAQAAEAGYGVLRDEVAELFRRVAR